MPNPHEEPDVPLKERVLNGGEMLLFRLAYPVPALIDRLYGDRVAHPPTKRLLTLGGIALTLPFSLTCAAAFGPAHLAYRRAFNVPFVNGVRPDLDPFS